MKFLIEWLYDRKNAVQHSEEVETWWRNRGFTNIWYMKPGVNAARCHKIDLTKIAWITIKPAPKPYMPPVGRKK